MKLTVLHINIYYIFNTLAESSEIPHECNPHLYLYKNKIIRALEISHSLSLMADGAYGGNYFASPSEEQEEKLEERYKKLEGYQANLINCMSNR